MATPHGSGLQLLEAAEGILVLGITAQNEAAGGVEFSYASQPACIQ